MQQKKIKESNLSFSLLSIRYISGEKLYHSFNFVFLKKHLHTFMLLNHREEQEEKKQFS